jgi:hypothetical protein
MPAWLAPVCEDRSVSHASRRWLSSASQREPVDLEEEDPGDVAGDRLAGPPCDAAGEAQRVPGVVVEAHQRADRHAERGGEHGDRERIPEVADVELVGSDLCGEQQHRGVEGEHEHEPDRHREREAQRRDHRRQDRVEHRDDRRDQHGAGEPTHLGSRHDAGGQQQAEGRSQPRGDQPQRP